jgi:trehalose 6-phosphate phosphatase
MEPWRCTDEDRRMVTAWAERLRSDVGLLPGVWVEDKGYSLAVHYRRSPDPEAAGRDVRRAAERLEGARMIAGKLVWNVLPRSAPGKGAALETARTWLGCDSAIYVGDDVTDEDVFRLQSPGRLLTVRVGPDSASKARFHLHDQATIDEFLRVLVALRRAAPGDEPAGGRGTEAGPDR